MTGKGDDAAAVGVADSAAADAGDGDGLPRPRALQSDSAVDLDGDVDIDDSAALQPAGHEQRALFAQIHEAVAQDSATIGRTAIELLLARAADHSRPVQTVTVPVELIARGSGELPRLSASLFPPNGAEAYYRLIAMGECVALRTQAQKWENVGQ